MKDLSLTLLDRPGRKVSFRYIWFFTSTLNFYVGNISYCSTDCKSDALYNNKTLKEVLSDGGDWYAPYPPTACLTPGVMGCPCSVYLHSAVCSSVLNHTDILTCTIKHHSIGMKKKNCNVLVFWAKYIQKLKLASSCIKIAPVDYLLSIYLLSITTSISFKYVRCH